MISDSPNIKTSLQILKDEVDGNVPDAMSKMLSGYSQTWMYQTRNGELFPSDESTGEESMEEIYHIKGREYHIYNITESENTVMIECVEQYPDEKTGQLYRTPQVLIIEFTDGKISRGRHYCDPRLSYLTLTDEVLNKAYRNAEPILVIK
jgi:ketosteroid isomerase-like protein